MIKSIQMTAELTITEINIYPIKSLGGISLQSSKLEPKGLQYDRRWMLVDAGGIFFTQRSHPDMALLQVNLNDDSISVHHKTKDFGILKIPFNAEHEKMKVRIWKDFVDSVTVSKQADDWFSDILGFNCRLVNMPEASRRAVNKDYSVNDDIVSFADGYPYLMIGEASLDLLNSKLEEKLPMNRFRPNLVFAGGKPHDEDRWKKFRINNAVFYGVKHCARCVVTTVNQDTGIKGKEPLRTLATYRRVNNDVLFGMNLVGPDSGEVILGDRIEILEWK